MKRTSLTHFQQEVLEQLIAEHGLIVTTQEVIGKLSFATEESKYRFVSQLSEAGWLVRIRHGLYQIADVSSLGTLTLSRYTIAHLLHPESYVSFEAALQFHGLFDQSLKSVSSVTTRSRSSSDVQGICYRFIKTQESSYFGFASETFDGRRVQIAHIEKAMIDLMQFRRSDATVDLVAEILRESLHSINLDQLTEFVLRSPVAVQRGIGFLLSTLDQENAVLKQSVQHSQSVTKLTNTSSQYSGAWRLYYDPYFVRRTEPA